MDCMEYLILIPELKMHLANLYSMKITLMHKSYEVDMQEQVSRVDGMIRSLEHQIFLLEG